MAFHEFSPEKLNESLYEFYPEVKKRNGDDFSKSMLVGIRSGINRHLSLPPYKKSFNIMNDSVFSSSNLMLKSLITDLKKKGLDTASHHPNISNIDLKKIMDENSFDLNSPEELQQHVFFNTQYFFCRRGRENLRNLTKKSFNFDIDDGQEFCELSFNEFTKNHKESTAPKPRMYATGQTNCPVASLKLYLQKLSQKSDVFYTRHRTSKSFKINDQTWYTEAALGVNTLGHMMKRISKRLNLEKEYTNHSIRATVVTNLSAAGLESREIMRVTGHKCERSLISYDRLDSAAQKRKACEILSGTNFDHKKHKKNEKEDNNENNDFGSETDLPSVDTFEKTATSSKKYANMGNSLRPIIIKDISNNTNCQINIKISK